VNLEKELDRLYGSPLGEFTPIRNELVRALGKAGEREAAAEVKSLRKPSVSAWAVNQLARMERLQVRSLLTSAERVREAQAELLAGGDAEELREAVTRQREVVGSLLGSAEEVLRAGGHPASEATLERIRKTLTAVAADEEGRKLVEAGRLSEDLEPAGFGAAAPARGAGRRRPARADSARKKRAEEAEARLDGVQAEAAEARERVQHAKEEARRAERAAQKANRRLEEEKRLLERLTARTDEARAALEGLRRT
jgi:hypothetical protein